MNLVNELQISAARDDVLTVLRNTKRLASKLALNDLEEWLKCEFEGYGKNPVPDYRLIGTSLSVKTHGPLIAGGMVIDGIQDFPAVTFGNISYRDSIGVIMSCLQDLGKMDIFSPIPEGTKLSEIARRRVRVTPEYA